MNLYIRWPEAKILDTKYCWNCTHPVWLKLTLGNLRRLLVSGLTPVMCTDCGWVHLFRMKVVKLPWA